MDFEIEQHCGSEYSERSEDRSNSRDGYRGRLWETRAGSIDLRIPKLRRGSDFPGFLELRRTAEKALVAVVQEAYIQGVSTRSVDELVKSMGMTGISKSQVSRLCKEINERINAFLDRPIEGDWPYLWIDATYVKVRQAGRIVSAAVIIAVGVNTDGIREVLGVAVGPSEAEPFWTDFLRSLTRRGLRGVKLIISDAHLGFRAAIAKVFKATSQRCRVHFIRNALAYAGKNQRQMALMLINTVFAQESGLAAALGRRPQERTCIVAIFERSTPLASGQRPIPNRAWIRRMLVGKLLIRGALGPFSSCCGRLLRVPRQMFDTRGDRMLGALLCGVHGSEFSRSDNRVRGDLGDFAFGNHP